MEENPVLGKVITLFMYVSLPVLPELLSVPEVMCGPSCGCTRHQLDLVGIAVSQGWMDRLEREGKCWSLVPVHLGQLCECQGLQACLLFFLLVGNCTSQSLAPKWWLS